MQIRFFIFLILFVATASGQTLRVEIADIYNFKPAQLSETQKELKFQPLDQFWEKVKSDTTKYLPELRRGLTSVNHNPFFYFDGAALLLSLSKNRFDKQLAADAIVKSDLDDISQREYVRTLNTFLTKESM